MESLFNKVVDLQACNFIKKGLQYSCFTVKFAKFQKNTFLRRTPPFVASEPNWNILTLKGLIKFNALNLMHNVPKWSNTL